MTSEFLLETRYASVALQFVQLMIWPLVALM